MDVLKVDYSPSSHRWERQEIKDVNFYAYDFVEANMDVSACSHDAENNLDNLISLGLTDTDYGTSNSTATVPYVLHINYPDHSGSVGSGQDWLRVNLVTGTKAYNTCQYKSATLNSGDGTGFVTQGSYVKPDASAKQHFRFDLNGIFWNHQRLDLSLWGDAAAAQETFEKLLTANTLYVGSTQGTHRSRATYHFVRAVHNSEYSNATGGEGSGFEHNPENGGDL